MRLGVLDVESDTIHLPVVDAHRGTYPTPMSFERVVLRLAAAISGAERVVASSETFRSLGRLTGAAPCSALCDGVNLRRLDHTDGVAPPADGERAGFGRVVAEHTGRTGQDAARWRR